MFFVINKLKGRCLTKLSDRFNNYCLFCNAIHESKNRGFSKEEEKFWEEYFSSLRNLFNPGTNYTDEEIDELGDCIQEELILKYHYDPKYVILTYCDILEACFSEEEKELNKENLRMLREQFDEEEN